MRTEIRLRTGDAQGTMRRKLVLIHEMAIGCCTYVRSNKQKPPPKFTQISYFDYSAIKIFHFLSLPQIFLANKSAFQRLIRFPQTHPIHLTSGEAHVILTRPVSSLIAFPSAVLGMILIHQRVVLIRTRSESERRARRALVTPIHLVVTNYRLRRGGQPTGTRGHVRPDAYPYYPRFRTRRRDHRIDVL